MIINKEAKKAEDEIIKKSKKKDKGGELSRMNSTTSQGSMRS